MVNLNFLKHLFGAPQKSNRRRDSEIESILASLISLLKDEGRIKAQSENLLHISNLPQEEQEQAYLALYLDVENLLITKRPVETQEAFSNKFLHGDREYTREYLRKKMKNSFKIRSLPDKIRILFLEGVLQQALLYEIMCNELFNGIRLANARISLRAHELPRGIRLQGNRLDFSILNATMMNKNMNQERIIILFRDFFILLYKKLQSTERGDLADEFIKRIYHFIQSYGFPIDMLGAKILPIKLEESEIASTREALEYVLSLIPQKDLVQPQLEKLKSAGSLRPEEQEQAYLALYLELEEFITAHEPPAVQKTLGREELIKMIRANIDITALDPRFKLLFLNRNEQIIELFILFTQVFLAQLIPLFEFNDLQKFIRTKTRGTLLEGIEISKTAANLATVEANVAALQAKEQETAISHFSTFARMLHQETEHALGKEETKNVLKPLLKEMQEKYSAIPAFHGFLKELPIVLSEKRTAATGSEAAKAVLEYLIACLGKENITRQRKEFETAKTLPLEDQQKAFFNIYAELEGYIVRNNPVAKGIPLTIVSIKEDIRKHVPIAHLEDQFQILFLQPDELLIKLTKDLVKESITNFIDKGALVTAERDLIKNEKLLSGATINEMGEFDLAPLRTALAAVKTNKGRVLESMLEKIVNTLFNTAKRTLGEIQAKRLFETSYAALQRKYGATSLTILKVVPKGILESEKFELLGKEQLQKTAEELTKVEMMKSEFMNIAAHELKTPLVPILSYLEMLLKEKKLKPDHRKKLKICYASAQRELLLVNDILDISKIESGTLRLELDELDLAKLLRDAAAECSPAIRQKKLAFRMQIPARLPIVTGDQRRITQVITNLINNATKFTERGSITLHAEEQENHLLVSVADTGIGISQENTKKLFIKFFQADTSARRKYGGTGLGLAICRGIVEGHNGKIWVQSELGQGTTFSFTIPFTKNKPIKQIKDKAPATRTKMRKKAKHKKQKLNNRKKARHKQ